MQEAMAPQKKAYVAPQVTRVVLSAEEVVLGSCKSESGIAGSKMSDQMCYVCGISIGS